MFKNILAVFACLLLAPALAAEAPPATYSKIAGGYVYFDGAGNADPQKDNRTQRKSLSEQAAISDAKVKLAYYMHSLPHKSGVTLQEVMEKDGTVERRVRAFIKGVEVVEREWDAEDNCRVSVRVNKKDLQRQFDLKAVR